MAAPAAPVGPADVRNDFRGRHHRSFQAYVAVVALAGIALLLHSISALAVADVLGLEPAFWVVFSLLLLAELRPLFTAGARDANGLVLSTCLVFAVQLRYGLPVALLVQALATAISDASRGKAPWRTAFNIGQYTLCWSVAALVMAAVGHTATVGDPLDITEADLCAAVLGGLAYFAVNQAVVTAAVALNSGRSLLRLVREDLAHESLTNGALLALAPLVVLVVEEGPAFLPLLVPPMLAVYKVAGIALERERQAMTDLLTGLPNRKLLAERTAHAVEGDVAALLLFDLDRFKEVNDTLGHHVGDQLLTVVADRLAAMVRPGDTVARLGGDEFSVLLPGMTGVDAEQTAARLLASVCAPVELEGLMVEVGASVGVAVSPCDGGNLDVLLQHADVAMYLAKESGGGVQTYDAARDRNSTGRLVMLGELRRALTTGELVLHYQPKASLASGRVHGVEALVRWQHPVRGLVPPDEFVPLAESSGLVEQLTAYVVDAALAQVAAWRAAGLDLTVAVNVSIQDLCGDVLAERVTAALRRHDVPASCLQLEVTEGSLFADPHRATATLARLDDLGVALSLDDFGTGYSSLGHLRRLPVREVKVDRSFVARMDSDVQDAAIVRSVIDLAAALGMHVVAEGVEDQGTWRLLEAMGCHSAQGWFLSRAQPADVLTPWLVDRVTALGQPLQPLAR